jgi:hypothetical protein
MVRLVCHLLLYLIILQPQLIFPYICLGVVDTPHSSTIVFDQILPMKRNENRHGKIQEDYILLVHVSH